MEPRPKYTLDDLDALTLLEAASPKQAMLEALCGDLDEGILADRIPGTVLIRTTTREGPLMRAQLALAADGDDEHTLRHLAVTSRYHEVLETVARNPSTPMDALEHLVNVAVWAAIPEYAAGTRRRRGQTRELQGCDIDGYTAMMWRVARYAAGNPRMPVWMLPALYDGDHGTDGRQAVRCGVAEHPHLPDDLIDRAAADADPYVRRTVARCKHLHAAALARLAADTDPLVRATLAHYQDAPEQICAQLVADPDPVVRASAADNPALPARFLGVLAADPDGAVIHGVLRNPGLTTGLYEAAVASVQHRRNSWYAFREAAQSPLITAWAASVLARMVPAEVAGNPHTPAEELERLAHPSASWRVRWAVANNPSCPLQVRIRLAAHDKSPDVRRTAAASLPETLRPQQRATLLDLTPGTIVEYRAAWGNEAYRLWIQQAGEPELVPSRSGPEEDFLVVPVTGIRLRVNGAPSRRHPEPVTYRLVPEDLEIVGHADAPPSRTTP